MDLWLLFLIHRLSSPALGDLFATKRPDQKGTVSLDERWHDLPVIQSAQAKIPSLTYSSLHLLQISLFLIDDLQFTTFVLAVQVMRFIVLLPSWLRSAS
jgi:hypothetical protein